MTPLAVVPVGSEPDALRHVMDVMMELTDNDDEKLAEKPDGRCAYSDDDEEKPYGNDDGEKPDAKPTEKADGKFAYNDDDEEKPDANDEEENFSCGCFASSGCFASRVVSGFKPDATPLADALRRKLADDDDDTDADDDKPDAEPIETLCPYEQMRRAVCIHRVELASLRFVQNRREVYSAPRGVQRAIGKKTSLTPKQPSNPPPARLLPPKQPSKFDGYGIRIRHTDTPDTPKQPSNPPPVRLLQEYHGPLLPQVLARRQCDDLE